MRKFLQKMYDLCPKIQNYQWTSILCFCVQIQANLNWNIIIIYCIKFREQNIHMFLHNIISQQISHHFPSDIISENDEIKNQPIDLSGTLLSFEQSGLNCEILSPQLIESYMLHPAILAHTNIQQSHRAKMHLWIVQNCHIRHLSYKTASLACYILDLYFSKGNNCQLQDLHQYGICSLRIANKLEDDVFIPINYDVFSRQKLVQIQAKICLKINFELNPITFTDIAFSLNHLWNSFRKQIRRSILNPEQTLSNLKDLSIQSRIVDLEPSFILVHETLELLYLIIDTLSYPIDLIVFNTFYMILFMQFHNYEKLLNQSKIQNLMTKSDPMTQIMTDFMSFCKGSNYQLRIEIDESCLMFIYPVYNALISESSEYKESKSNEIAFNPQDQNLKLHGGCFQQTMMFKNKKGSLRRYMKRQMRDNLRKCSQITRL